MLLARSRCSLLCRALCSRLCIFEESGIPGDHLYVKMFSADIRCHDMDCANAFSWVHLLFESLLPNFLVFFEGIEDNTEKAAATFGPPRRAAELARVAAPGMLGANARLVVFLVESRNLEKLRSCFGLLRENDSENPINFRQNYLDETRANSDEMILPESNQRNQRKSRLDVQKLKPFRLKLDEVLRLGMCKSL